jgi:hypothetical protein
MYYDSESRRQRQRERMAEIRAEYQSVQRHRESRISAAMQRYSRSAWSHVRWAVPRRAPVSRA